MSGSSPSEGDDDDNISSPTTNRSNDDDGDTIMVERPSRRPLDEEMTDQTAHDRGNTTSTHKPIPCRGGTPCTQDLQGAQNSCCRWTSGRECKKNQTPNETSDMPTTSGRRGQPSPSDSSPSSSDSSPSPPCRAHNHMKLRQVKDQSI